MRLLCAFGWLPVPVFYVERLWGGIGGFAPLIFILLIDKFRDDDGVHQHEIEHIEQAWRGWLVVYALRYLLSARYRMRSEVAAYRRQIACYPAGTSIDFAVRALTEIYRLHITEDEARRALTSPPGADL